MNVIIILVRREHLDKIHKKKTVLKGVSCLLKSAVVSSCSVLCPFIIVFHSLVFAQKKRTEIFLLSSSVSFTYTLGPLEIVPGSTHLVSFTHSNEANNQQTTYKSDVRVETVIVKGN